MARDKTDEPVAVRREDYAPTPYAFPQVHLDFKLEEDITTVTSTIIVTPTHTASSPPDMVLDGRNDIKLISVAIDNKPLTPDQYTLTPKTLTLPGDCLPTAYSYALTIVVHIKPQANTKLEGLYKSGGNYCTQCEAMGFRGITYFYDRPDVMSKYTVRVEAAKDAYPVLLSNGNLIEQGDGGEGRHFAVWEDPFLKPCYLFALVAGDLAKKEDTFKTMSGKDVALRIFTQHHNASKVDWAMASLKRAMKWDEEAFGREYDLELFNIVAVDDFNMGAMENKSLNVFNSAAILAVPEETTDGMFVRIEGIVGHEYFHNWTGNRVTCRDWFQLTLKEGLTVYRDQEFTASLHSSAVRRIEVATFIRSAQFNEDAGAMSHPIRPDSYIKMDNFYTGTVYRKGAEVIRMYRTLLGVDGFRKGMDLYFERHDGQAVTCDDFLAAMADANGADLSNLAKWYSQAGTPTVTVTTAYDAAAKTYTITAKQTTPPTPGQPTKIPVLIPLEVGLLGEDGAELPLHLKGEDAGATAPKSTVLRHENAEDTFVFENVPSKPVPSILRNFSAPVKLVVEGQSTDDLLLLLANDTDPVNRWDAGQRLMKSVVQGLYGKILKSGSEVTGENKAAVFAAAESVGGVEQKVIDAFGALMKDEIADKALTALAISMPLQSELVGSIAECNPLLLHQVRMFVRKSLAKSLKTELQALVKENDIAPSVPYSPQIEQSAKRQLKNAALGYLSALDGDDDITESLKERYFAASNMTDALAAMSSLVHKQGSARTEVLADFEKKWAGNGNVMLSWLSAVSSSNCEGNLAVVEGVLKHGEFKITTPNCVYAVARGLASSPVNFHAADGSGYKFIADFVLSVDKVNQIAASKVAVMFTSWKQFDAKRQGLLKTEMSRILASNELSENVFEVISKCMEQ